MYEETITQDNPLASPPVVESQSEAPLALQEHAAPAFYDPFATMTPDQKHDAYRRLMLAEELDRQRSAMAVQGQSAGTPIPPNPFEGVESFAVTPAQIYDEAMSNMRSEMAQNMTRLQQSVSQVIAPIASNNMMSEMTNGLGQAEATKLRELLSSYDKAAIANMKPHEVEIFRHAARSMSGVVSSPNEPRPGLNSPGAVDNDVIEYMKTQKMYGINVDEKQAVADVAEARRVLALRGDF